MAHAAVGRNWLGRLVCPFILLFHLLSPLEAVSNPENLAFIVKNDSATLGVSENPDDLRSYGSAFFFACNNGWFGKVQLSGMTNRSAGPTVDGRYDELELFSGYTFRLSEDSPINAVSFTLEPSIGMLLSGHLGLESVQNFWHNVIDVPTIELQYDNDGELLIAPRFSLTGSLLYSEHALWFDSTDILFHLRGIGTFAPGYEGFAIGSMELGQRTTATQYLMLGFGYAYRKNLDGRLTHRVVNESEQGLMASFDARFGLLVMTYQWYLDSSHGFGGFGLDIGGMSSERWFRSDLVMTLSMRAPYENLMTSVRYILRPSLSVFASNSYTMRLLSYDRQLRENLSTWHFGFDYELAKFKNDLMVPFISLGVGFRRFLVVGPGDGPDSLRAVMYERLRFSSEFFGGVRILQRGEIQWGGISYGVELSAGLAYLDTRGLVDMVDGVALVEMTRWQPMVRVGMTMGGSL